MLQILGGCMIFCGCLGSGYELIRRKQEIIRIMEIWEYILEMFVSEIMYKKETLGYACYEIAEKIGGKEGKFLESVGRKTEEKKGECFYQIWEEECKRYCKEVSFSGREAELIKEFGKMTGFEDSKVHQKMIGMQLEKWSNERIRKQEELWERKKLILTLSSCIGMMMVLILW